MVMSAQDLAKTLDSLTQEQQDSVVAFIEFLKSKTAPTPSPYAAAVNEFIDEHPELLRRLAQ